MYFSVKNYREALKEFELAEDLNTAQKLQKAYCYSHEGLTCKAEKSYLALSEAIWPFDDQYMFDYAEVLRKMKKYEEAKAVYQAMKNVPATLIYSCDWAIKNGTEDKTIHLYPIKAEADKINGFYKQGEKVLLAENHKGLLQEFKWLDIDSGLKEDYHAKTFFGYNLNAPNLVGDSLLIFSENLLNNGNRFFRMENSMEALDPNREYKLGIEVLDLKKKKIKEFPFNSDDYGCTHPYYEVTKKRLYFASEMPGGFGGFDLYYSDKTDKGWTKPVNLGGKINTPYNEGFPFEKDGILYFSSTGHAGYGGYDIFKASLENKQLPVVNLMQPINSSFDDIAYQQNSSEKGYFVTARKNLGKDQIIHFTRDSVELPQLEDTEVVVRIENDTLILEKGKKAHFYDMSVKDFYAAAIEFNRVHKRKPAITGIVAKDGYGDLKFLKVPNQINWKTNYRLSLLPALEDELEVKYFDQYCLFRVKQAEKICEIPVEVKEGGIKNYKCGYWWKNNFQEHSFPYVYFKFNVSDLEKKSKVKLRKLAKFLRKHSNVNIGINGFTDPTGTEMYNHTLSYKRALHVAQFLIKNGVKKDRIKYIGNGVYSAYKGVGKESIPYSSQRVANYQFLIK
jgi:outer membrane protein OmpA-like peptidoglycan-associated protein